MNWRVQGASMTLSCWGVVGAGPLVMGLMKECGRAPWAGRVQRRGRQAEGGERKISRAGREGADARGRGRKPVHACERTCCGGIWDAAQRLGTGGDGVVLAKNVCR